MLSAKTVFVVGAGASFEAGLPLGRDLKNIIAQKLDIRFEHLSRHVGKGDLDIFDALRRQYRGNEINDYLQVCWNIRDGIVLSPSIDDFIDNHQHDARVALCGKLAIFKSIVEAEKRSKLFFSRQNISDTVNFPYLQDTWYTGFYELVSNRVPLSKLDSIFDNVSLITFNYDRCIEHYLTHAIATHYRVAPDVARELVEKLTIHRPYGKIGPYFGSSQKILEFGGGRIPNLEDLMKDLQTYTEQVAEGAVHVGIGRAVREAEVVVFLGNAFHENNMRLLTTRSAPARIQRIYATRKGISDADLEIVKQQLQILGGTERSVLPSVHFADTCYDLFDKYRMSLRQSG